VRRGREIDLKIAELLSKRGAAYPDSQSKTDSEGNNHRCQRQTVTELEIPLCPIRQNGKKKSSDQPCKEKQENNSCHPYNRSRGGNSRADRDNEEGAPSKFVIHWAPMVWAAHNFLCDPFVYS
jgi:hypothetical protein